MLDMRVDAAVRDETEEVHVAAPRRSPPKRIDERLVLEERTVLDRLAHPHEVLEEDAARADREVTDLGVPHLAVGEADCGA